MASLPLQILPAPQIIPNWISPNSYNSFVANALSMYPLKIMSSGIPFLMPFAVLVPWQIISNHTMTLLSMII